MDDRIQSLLKPGKEQAGQLLQRLQTDHITDAVVPIGPDAGPRRPSIVFGSGQVGIEYGAQCRAFHPHAATQFGSKLGIPSTWLRESLTGQRWQREMVADVMAITLAHTDQRSRLLLRSVGGQVRGVLSDQYRRLHSPILANAYAEVCNSAGAVPYRASCDDIRWQVSALLPQPLTIELPNHGQDVVAACLHIRSSDFGAGPLELSFELLRVVCVNGLIGKSALRQVHLGGRLPDDLGLSDQTYRLDSETQASAIQDIGRKLLSTEHIRQELLAVHRAAEKAIDPQNEVQGLVRAKRITKTEAKALEQVMIRNEPAQIPSGPATTYKMAHALSWVSKSVAAGRRFELEDLAGSLVLVSEQIG